MTRFARAKGSRASNERLPEAATSWLEMKQQMVQAQTSKVEKIDIRNFSPEEDVAGETAWAEFENVPKKGKKKKLLADDGINARKRKQVIKWQDVGVPDVGCETFDVNENPSSIKKNKRKDLRLSVKKTGKKQGGGALAEKNKLKQQKDKNVGMEELDISRKMDNLYIKQGRKEMKKEGLGGEKRKKTCIEPVSVVEDKKKEKKLKKKLKQGKDVSESMVRCNSDRDVRNNTDELNTSTNIKQRGKKRKSKQKNSDKIPLNEKTNPAASGQFLNMKRTRVEKEVAELPFKRRKLDSPTTIEIDGREVEIRLFDGFPVLKDDWDRLTQLKMKMMKEGIPKHEIWAAMKLERRRAEKALARERKKVCFCCRKSGHLLSECPDIGEGQSLNFSRTGTGVCFKCGSTEHKQSECRVTQQDDFKFAKCFVCGEEGHISRQCPDNPRGLYPKGGGCRICGDVTHLRKDCPEELQQKQESVMQLETLAAGGALEALDPHEKRKRPASGQASKQKYIKFM